MSKEFNTYEEYAKYTAYLDELREDGTINMMDAAIYLQQEFDLAKQNAKDVFIKWMDEYL